MAGLLYVIFSFSFFQAHSQKTSGVAPISQLVTSESERLAVEARIDLNRASSSDLILLPGIGPSLAEAIVRERDGYGIYQHVAEVVRVRGIGPKKLESLWPYLCAEPQDLCVRELAK